MGMVIMMIITQLIIIIIIIIILIIIIIIITNNNENNYIKHVYLNRVILVAGRIFHAGCGFDAAFPFAARRISPLRHSFEPLLLGLDVAADGKGDNSRSTGFGAAVDPVDDDKVALGNVASREVEKGLYGVDVCGCERKAKTNQSKAKRSKISNDFIRIQQQQQQQNTRTSPTHMHRCLKRNQVFFNFFSHLKCPAS